MDRVNQYRQTIQNVFQEYTQLYNQKPEGVDVLAICDETLDSYALVNVGWHGKNRKRRINSMAVLMRIIDGKIWVEQDETMYQFVEELLDAGVPKEDIVLGFHAPSMRPLTDFAVA